LKLNRLEETKKLFPHWLDKNPYSNFSRTLQVLNNQELDKRHMIKMLEWVPILEKPLQIHKEQTEPYEYSIFFKVLVRYIKEINIYLNPLIQKDQVVSYDALLYHTSFSTDDTDFFEWVYKGSTRKKYVKSVDEETGQEITELVNIDPEDKLLVIPHDNFVLEVKTWDDYHFLKGFPENDYSVDLKHNNQIRIDLEEISYSKYLTFRVHKENLKMIEILKNNQVIYQVDFLERIYDYTDTSTKVSTVELYDYIGNHEVTRYNSPVYVADPNKDEYVYRILLNNEDFNEEGYLKDNYDFRVTLFNKYHKSCEERDKVIVKRYSGFDNEFYDCFDHDESLDLIGKLVNVPRLRFEPKYSTSNCSQLIDYYRKTLPPFNNRLTEDDYHYMERMKYYVSHFNKTYFPVLELWKHYGINSTLVNRKRLLSVSDVSYICPLDNYESKTVEEFSVNKTNIVQGVSNQIIREDTEWYESVIVDNLFIVPSAKYNLSFSIDSNRITDFEEDNHRFGYRIYYFDKNDICHYEDSFTPTPSKIEEGKYYFEEEIITRENGMKINIVLECDVEFNFSEVSLKRVTIVDSDAVYMTTKEDYNSCVYDIYASYNDLPSNIRFKNNDIFQQLIDKSLPLTRKAYFNLSYDFDNSSNYLELNTSLLFDLENYFDSTNNHGEDESYYEVYIDTFVKEDCWYNLLVTFRNDNISSSCEDINTNIFIHTYIQFKGIVNNMETILDTEELDIVQTTNEFTFHHNFITPPNTDSFKIIFETTNNEIFEYKDLKLVRKETIGFEEII